MPKRKSPDELAATGRKRKQPFTAPKTARIKAIIQRNSTESLLLRLPYELRDRIWRYVFNDGRLLHIKHVGIYEDYEFWSTLKTMYNEWRNAFCVSQDSPYDTYEKSKNAPQTSGTSGFVWTEAQEWFPHSICEQYMEPTGAHERFCIPKGTTWSRIAQPKEKVQLQLFRVCRQVYFEANVALWSNTTFSFDDPHSFRQFMASRTTYQKKHLCKLHLELQFLSAGDINTWNSVFPITLVRSLTGLRVFHLHVRHENSRHYLSLVSDSIRDITFENLLNFQILPLRDVTVIWQKHYGCVESGAWSHARHREWAEYFKGRFLDPGGLRVWQEYKDEQKRIRDEQKAISLTR